MESLGPNAPSLYLLKLIWKKIRIFKHSSVQPSLQKSTSTLSLKKNFNITYFHIPAEKLPQAEKIRIPRLKCKVVNVSYVCLRTCFNTSLLSCQVAGEHFLALTLEHCSSSMYLIMVAGLLSQTSLGTSMQT